MSANSNVDAAANSQGTSGQFHARVHHGEPLTTHGHQPGRITSENEQVPEYQAETFPPGTAPPSKTFQPDTTSEVPAQTATSAAGTAASETLGGTDSAAVHTGLGHPGSGQSSNEIRHDGGRGASRTGGLEGVGASGVQSAGLVDKRVPEHAGQRTLDSDEKVTGRGTVGGDAAEDRLPETADRVAAENN